MNLANLITVIRLILLPFIIFALANGLGSLSLALLTFALVSDMVDGFVARRMGQITQLGQVLDPLADKAFFLSLFGFFTWNGQIPPIAFLLLLLPYSVLVLGGGLLYRFKGEVIPSNALGKTSSVIISLGLIAVFFNLPYALVLIYVGIATCYLATTVYFVIASREAVSWTRGNN